MRFHRSWHGSWSAGDKDHNFALHILARQIVVVQLWDGQPVADKHGTGFEILGGLRTYAEHGIVAEFHGLYFSVVKQIERATRFVNLDHLEIHWLPVAIDPRGL